jgi:hypothetical protein
MDFARAVRVGAAGGGGLVGAGREGGTPPRPAPASATGARRRRAARLVQAAGCEGAARMAEQHRRELRRR